MTDEPQLSVEGLATLDAGAKELLSFFRYSHLPAGALRETSAMFSELATNVVNTVPSGRERTAALRKLLEAKDCAVRACLSKKDG